MSLEIQIGYKLIGAEDWVHQTFSPEVYFDPDPDEPWDVDSVPKFDHAIEYFPEIQLADVAFTRISIHSPKMRKTLSITETFWNGGGNRVSERVDTVEGKETYWEIILTSLISTAPHVTEILRMGRVSGVLKVHMHNFVETLPDGTNVDRDVPLSR